jgi:hypothetical protein
MAMGRAPSCEATKNVKKLAVEDTAEGIVKMSGEPLMIESELISVEHEDAKN